MDSGGFAFGTLPVVLQQSCCVFWTAPDLEALYFCSKGTRLLVRSWLGQMRKIDHSFYNSPLILLLRRLETLDTDCLEGFGRRGMRSEMVVNLLTRNVSSVRNLVVYPIFEHNAVFGSLKWCTSLRSLSLPSRREYFKLNFYQGWIPTRE